MIVAKHHPLVVAFFRHYADKSIRRHFHKVVVNGTMNVNNHPVMLLSNHISWWDGFWALYLNSHYLKKKFHFMMDEKELSKRWLFSYIGGFSIARNKTLFQTLNYCSGLLENNDNLVLIYPQGKLYSSHQKEVSFLKGIERIKIGEHVKVLLLVQLTDYFENRKPTLYLYLKEADAEDLISKNFEQCYNDFYKTCIEQHSRISV